jgi:hypothetical protein
LPTPFSRDGSRIDSPSCASGSNGSSRRGFTGSAPSCPAVSSPISVLMSAVAHPGRRGGRHSGAAAARLAQALREAGVPGSVAPSAGSE